MPLQRIKPTQVSSMGESPAQARRRMETSGAATPEQPQARGEEVPELTAEHMAAIRKADEGFRGGPGGTFEEAEELTEPPTPSKAMDMIRQLSQENVQLMTERNVALDLVEHYRTKYGDLEL